MPSEYKILNFLIMMADSENLYRELRDYFKKDKNIWDVGDRCHLHRCTHTMVITENLSEIEKIIM